MKNLFFIGAILLSICFVFTACSEKDSKAKTEQLANDEMYTCTMHNEVMSNHPGKCPKCEMKLERQKMTAEQQKMMKEGNYVKPKE
ncbi:MAG TPA: heavy metal-binding domain-containing protein [Flavitalea sp.]|nr:heavy metal-binding domain-containing protein [Flavitalea sp.]